MPEEKKLGIEDLKDVAVLLAKLGVSVAQCASEKKFQFSYFMDDLQAIPAAIGGISEVPAQLKDIDGEEAKELIAVVIAELGPLGIDTEGTAKLFIQAGISFVEGVTHLIKGLKSLKEK